MCCREGARRSAKGLSFRFGSRLVAVAVLGVLSTVAAPVGGALAQTYELMVSTSPDRAQAVPLDGQAVSGDIYVFTSPDTGVSATWRNRVTFFLDDPAMSGRPIKAERAAPYDFAGGGQATARPFDSDVLALGSHIISARLPLANGETAVVHASFTAGPVTANHPPVIAPMETVFLAEQDSIDVIVAASDSDGDQIQIRALQLPPFASLFDQGDGTATLSLIPMAGDEGDYAISIEATDGELTDVAGLTVKVLPSIGAPQFVVHPQDQAVREGDPATFSAAASGTTPLAYQWQRDGQDVAGAFGQKFTTAPASADDDGARIRAIVTNIDGSILSKEATLSVRSSAPVVVNPNNPTWLQYADGTPFFLCAPGEPEGFLYRGSRNGDGTRSGDQAAIIDRLKRTGANGLYLQIIRSHGGDGRSDHNPFINSDPARGLDPDILDQWEDWFTQMDAAGIQIYLFFFDDSANIWGSGDTVPSAERAFLASIVERFKHHPNLVWVIAEEYSEAFSARRVSNMAAVIRNADDRRHPIAVHKLSGLSFGEFAEDPNIDQFSIQYNVSSPRVLHDGVVRAFEDARGRYNLNVSESAGGGTGTNGRRKNWAAAMGGAYVMVFEWNAATTSEAELAGCGRMVRFMEGTNFHEMEPRDDLALSATKYVLADGNGSAILYAANADGDLGLRNQPAGSYDLRWLDIVTGAIVEQDAVSVTGGDATWPRPNGIGPELAVWVRPTGSGPANQPPVASAAANPTSGIAPHAVSFDAGGSFDPEGSALGYAWDFGDGTSGTGTTVQHTYTKAGKYQAVVTVTDAAGANDSAMLNVTVDTQSGGGGGGGGGNDYALLVSASADRADARALNGQSLSGNAYIFTGPDEGVDANRLQRVLFFLDDPNMTGNPIRAERTAPYDFAGGGVATAWPLSVSEMAPGPHTITASLPLADGTRKVIHATFTAAPEGQAGGGGYALLVSASPDRTGARALQGESLAGRAYIFTGPDEGVTTDSSRRVLFFLDDPNMNGDPIRAERAAPYDFAGGGVATARPLSVSEMAPGPHTITASLPLADGTREVVHATFTAAP